MSNNFRPLSAVTGDRRTPSPPFGKKALFKPDWTSFKMPEEQAKKNIKAIILMGGPDKGTFQAKTHYTFTF